MLLIPTIWKRMGRVVPDFSPALLITACETTIFSLL